MGWKQSGDETAGIREQSRLSRAIEAWLRRCAVTLSAFGWHQSAVPHADVDGQWASCVADECRPSTEIMHGWTTLGGGVVRALSRWPPDLPLAGVTTSWAWWPSPSWTWSVFRWRSHFLTAAVDLRGKVLTCSQTLCFSSMWSWTFEWVS